MNLILSYIQNHSYYIGTGFSSKQIILPDNLLNFIHCLWKSLKSMFNLMYNCLTTKQLFSKNRICLKLKHYEFIILKRHMYEKWSCNKISKLFCNSFNSCFSLMHLLKEGLENNS